MNTKLVIVADLGLLRAYREVQGQMDHQPHLELVEEVKSEAAHEKLSEQLTDQAGRFPRGSGTANVMGDLSAGERLNLETEQNRRLTDQLAERINLLLADQEVTRCSLAASAPIHKQLLDALDQKALSKINHLLASNLTKIDPSKLAAYFEKADS